MKLWQAKAPFPSAGAENAGNAGGSGFPRCFAPYDLFYDLQLCRYAARFKLAQAVEYMPLPVVAGYLSFVGELFCLK